MAATLPPVPHRPAQASGEGALQAAGGRPARAQTYRPRDGFASWNKLPITSKRALEFDAAVDAFLEAATDERAIGEQI